MKKAGKFEQKLKISTKNEKFDVKTEKKEIKFFWSKSGITLIDMEVGNEQETREILKTLCFLSYTLPHSNTLPPS